jgi:hypothetical protein
MMVMPSGGIAHIPIWGLSASPLPSPFPASDPPEARRWPVIRELIFGQDYAKALVIRRNNFRT